MSQLPALRALLIDLDDTLYPELSYVDSGFAHVATIIASQGGLPAELVLHFMRYDFMKYGRAGIFDRTLAHFNLSQLPVPPLVAAYRTHSPAIQFYPGVQEALLKLRSRYRLAVVTDGATEMQRAKVAALGLEDLVDGIFFCSAEGASKPDPATFLLAAAHFDLSLEAALIVGDDPYSDIEAARRGGFPACRVRSGRFAALAGLMPDHNASEISGFSELPRHLESLSQ